MVGGAHPIGYVSRLSHQDFIVRAGRPHEESAILELWGQARSTHATTADFPEDVQRLLSDMPGSLLVASTDGVSTGRDAGPDGDADPDAHAGGGPDGEAGTATDPAILGVLIAAWDGWRGNMYRLAVRPEHRRRGIGLALVRAGEEHLRRQGARRITALVGYEDELAAAFWESAGYPRDREIGRRVRNL
jgi:ribosomal protein S18 acetylase RimI-like enzyme